MILYVTIYFSQLIPSDIAKKTMKMKEIENEYIREFRKQKKKEKKKRGPKKASKKRRRKTKEKLKSESKPKEIQRMKSQMKESTWKDSCFPGRLDSASPATARSSE